jgi:HAD superfamily hydrolase (TIGR01490 family)
MSKTLILFDFDGTLTKKDTFPQFIFFSVGSFRAISGFVLFSPMILLYVLKIISGDVLKEKVTFFFFRGKKENELKRKGQDFIDNLLQNGMNPDLIKQLESFKNQENDICVVSASLNLWIEPFCKLYGIEHLCTELDFANGVFTGKFKTPNCNHEEKTIRIKQKYNLAQYTKIIAFGNSNADKPMFALANETHLVK